VNAAAFSSQTRTVSPVLLLRKRVGLGLVSHWNDNPEPFAWTKPADEILNKVARGQATLDRITKSATHH